MLQKYSEGFKRIGKPYQSLEVVAEPQKPHECVSPKIWYQKTINQR